MNIFSGLEEIVKAKHPMAKHTWYGIGGEADYYITPRNVEQLKDVAKRCNENEVPIYVLGFGSNLLISDNGVRGAVIKLESDEFKKIEFHDDKITAWAGAELSKLVLECVEKGLSGIECLTGIPGSIGGSVRMNAGGSFGDIAAAIESVSLMDYKGEVFEKSKPELMFDYRHSNITAKYILNAKLQLSKGDPDQILRNVKEVWIYKKNHQPLNTRNSGCIFKNPRGMAAGALIDRAGLKGLQVGKAQVSEKHANFIIAHEGCSSHDVLTLIENIQKRVREQFEVELEREIEIWE